MEEELPPLTKEQINKIEQVRNLNRRLVNEGLTTEEYDELENLVEEIYEETHLKLTY
jgi:hypothetical protein